MSAALSRFVADTVAPGGQSQRIECEAASERALALELLAKGHTPTHIRLLRDDWWSRLNRPIAWRQGPRLAELALFAEHMGEMLGAGLTVEHALTVISRQRGRGPGASLADGLLARVREGSALSAALRGGHFPAQLWGMVQAAERSGRLREAFADAARSFQQQLINRRTLANALAYPAIILCTLVIVLGFVLGFVIPQFASVFAGDEARLPLLTRWVLLMSEALTRHGTALLAALLGLGLALWYGARAALGNARLRRLPFVEALLGLDLARVLGVLGTLLASGVDLPAAFSSAAATTRSNDLVVALERAGVAIREGQAVSEVLRNELGIPEATLSIIQVGEHSGQLGRMIVRAARLLEMECEARIARVLALVNPIAVLLMGAAVGAVVAGVMLGIMSINQLAVRG